jgi:hypothetical protein
MTRKHLHELRKEFPTAEITINGSGHYALSWSVFTVIAAATPSDQRSIHNLRAEIRRRLKQNSTPNQED